ncbi:MAG: hypothetical protein KC713_10465, partial [Candidatus Omnitrophica bacterium]|nr:hypothetical protein [Candidatus Omnitrophota bacterium]
KTKIFFENARFAKHFDDPQSPYFERSKKLKAKVEGYVSNCKKDPEDIARLVQKLIEAPHPPFRSVPDKEANALRFFRRILPFGLYKKMIKKALSE